MIVVDYQPPTPLDETTVNAHLLLAPVERYGYHNVQWTPSDEGPQNAYDR